MSVSIEEKFIHFKDKLDGFKDTVDGIFTFLDDVAKKAEEGKPVKQEEMDLKFLSFTLALKEKSEFIKEKIDDIKEKLNGKPIATVFNRLENMFEEYKIAFQMRWATLKSSLENLDQAKVGDFKLMLKAGKEECKDIMEKVKEKVKEIMDSKSTCREEAADNFSVEKTLTVLKNFSKVDEKFEIQKQLQDLFCKKEFFRKFHRKTPKLETILNVKTTNTGAFL